MFTMLLPELVAIGTFRPQLEHFKQTPVVDLGAGMGQLGRSFSRAELLPGSTNRNLRKMLGTYEPTSVLCHYANLGVHFLEQIRRSDAPWYVHCHGYDVTWARWNSRQVGRRRRGAAYRRRLLALSGVSTLIANSELTRQRLIAIGIPSDRIVTKYIGVPIGPEQPRSSNATNDVHVLYLGRLVDHKGPLETIAAFELACARGMNGRLSLAGGGPLLAQCRRRACESSFSDRISVLGEVTPDEGEQLRMAADIFTAHNQHGKRSNQIEAYGVSPVEAMASGLPVVTGRSGGLQETVEDGVTGFLFQPGDVDTHAQLLHKLAQDPILRVRLGANGRKRAISRFSLDIEEAALRGILG